MSNFKVIIDSYKDKTFVARIESDCSDSLDISDIRATGETAWFTIDLLKQKLDEVIYELQGLSYGIEHDLVSIRVEEK